MSYMLIFNMMLFTRFIFKTDIESKSNVLKIILIGNSKHNK